MRRRTYLATLGAVCTGLAGCTEDSGGGNGGSDGEVVVDERVFSDALYRFDAEEGDTITTELVNEQGYRAIAIIFSRDVDETVMELTAETDAAKSTTAPMTTTYAIEVTGERADVTVTLE